jgi:hypothetical protein
MPIKKTAAMKGSILITIIIALSAKLSAQESIQKDSTEKTDNSYTVSFEFTGEVNRSTLDSVFALHYTLPQSSKVVLETEESSKEVDLTQSDTEQNIQVKQDSTNIKTHLYIRNYDRYNLPIPVSFQNKQGNKRMLYLKKANGKRISPQEFKEAIRQNRQLYRMHQQETEAAQQQSQNN